MCRDLDALDPRFRAKAFEFLARCVEAQIPVLIVDTVRTIAEQKDAVARGVSKTLNSKHLTGLAMDVCPFDQFQLHGPDKLQWDTRDPVWARIGIIAEKCGLKWGGRWANPYDPGHVEFPT